MLHTILVLSEGLWAIGWSGEEVTGLLKEDLSEEVMWGWPLGSPASQAAGSPRVKIVS